ncbi:MAG TPA: ankyrin repeat domain-containing protein [Clostridia bacterium]|nr:ankyrin repeat domain-containing protein [Clostridia bacterium]
MGTLLTQIVLVAVSLAFMITSGSAQESKLEILREIKSICQGGPTLNLKGERATIKYDKKSVELSVAASNALEIREGGTLIDQINNYTSDKYQSCITSTIKALGLSVSDSSLKFELNPNSADGEKLVQAVLDNENFDKVLDQVGNPNVIDSQGRVPLVEAAKIGDVSMTLSLLDRGADPNLGRYDKTLRGFYHPLAMAVSIFDGETLGRFWAREGRRRPQEEDPAFCRVLIIEKVQVAQALVANGANIEGDSSRKMFTPLMRAAGSTLCSPVELMEFLKDHGAQVKAVRQGLHGNITALEIAVRYGFYSTVKWLARNGADPNFRGMAGKTPLYDAIDYAAASLDRTAPDGIGDHLCNNDSDNAATLKFRVLLDAGGDMALQTSSGDSPRDLLLQKLGGRCAQPACQGRGQVGYRVCFERMMRHVRDKPAVRF